MDYQLHRYFSCHILSEIDNPISFGSHVINDDKVKRAFEFPLMCLGSFQTLLMEFFGTILARCFIWSYIRFCKSSHQTCSVKQGVLKNFANFTGKHLC